MTEIRGIDVSAWQETVQWDKVAASGVKVAILRCTSGKTNLTAKDIYFEKNYKGCIDNGIAVGVYRYSYAKTIDDVKTEAKGVIDALKDKEIKYPVFFDLEETWQQQNWSKDMFTLAMKTFKQMIEDAGYTFGLYTNVNWLRNVLPSSAQEYPLWIARYSSNDTGKIVESLRVDSSMYKNCIAWQYSANGKISPMICAFDMDVFYKDYAATNVEPEEHAVDTQTTYKYTKKDAIDLVLKIAKAEIGYLEKATNQSLDNFTANAGSNNYTKYWRDIYPQFQGQPWCACFVSWCLKEAFGLDAARKLLKHWPFVYCPTLGSLFTRYANPEVGDIVIFYRNGEFAHTGIVTKVEGDKFWTVEGNTSGASGVIANGGGVCEKSYYNSSLPGTKFCRIDWNYAASTLTTLQSVETEEKPVEEQKQEVSTNVYKDAQIHLNNFVSAGLVVDGDIGPKSKAAYRKALQTALNKDYNAKLVVDGVFGTKSQAALKKVVVKEGSKGYLVTVLEIGLLMNGFGPLGVQSPGEFGAELKDFVGKFQSAKGLVKDYEAGCNTFMALQK